MQVAAESSSVFGELIHKYTRAQAIEDGVLVDVTETAKEAGIKFPVAVTIAVHGGYVVPDERSRRWGQSESGRLWDVLSVFRFYAKTAKPATDTITFPVTFIMKERQRHNVMLKAMIGPGDAGEPVVTIMLPNED